MKYLQIISTQIRKVSDLKMLFLYSFTTFVKSHPSFLHDIIKGPVSQDEVSVYLYLWMTVSLCCSTWSIFHDFLKRNFSIINSVCDVPGAASPVPWLGWWDTWGRSRWRSCSRPSTCSTLTGAATSAGGAQTKCPSRLLPVSQWVIWFLFWKVFLENLQQGTRIRHEKSWDESNWEGHSWHP